MKTILLFMLIGSRAMASDVKITSFKFLEHSAHFSPTAEICGQLISPTGKSESIKIISDPDSKSPGEYIAMTSKNGKFCQVIATYSGNATADLEK